jgi:AcrR family transcriptional regulator
MGSTRSERQAETRARLLDAAVEVCAERGLRQARVEEIAARAGYSTGAIYSNFAGKDDLLLAVFEQRLEPRLRALATPLIEARTAAEQAGQSGELIRVMLAQERSYLLLLCEFWAYAAREPGVRERFAKIRRGRRAVIQAMIEERVRRRGIDVHPGSAELAAGFLACAIGVLFEGLVDPELDAEAVYAGAFELLSEGSARPAAQLAAAGSGGA